MIKIQLKTLILLSIVVVLSSCSQKTIIQGNPAAEGFNLAGSDQKAIDIADECMEAMGGRTAYENARYLSWNFFGSRKHVWDKKTGNVYIKSLKDNYELNMNIHDMKGKLRMNNMEVTNPDSLSKYLQKGKEMWINDSYWLVMPYKLKDSGVTLKYLGEGKTTEGSPADKLELTFNNVGVTPDNKYIVYVGKLTKFVLQWDFYTTTTDEEPRFSTPWKGWAAHGGIMLCGDRGNYALTDILVSEKLAAYFE